MPRRKTTRAQDRASRIQRERELNEAARPLAPARSAKKSSSFATR